MFPTLRPVGRSFWQFSLRGSSSPSMSVTYFKRYRMEVDLTRRTIRPVPLAAEYRLRPWSPELLELHGEAKYLSFHGEIDSTIFSSLASHDGCLELMQGIAAGTGFVPEATWLIETTDPSGQPEACGTIQGVRFDPLYGAIQNVGVVPFHRGQGLGAALLTAALIGFQQVGLRRAFLDVTAKNVGAIRLYQRLGFRRTKTLYRSVELATG